MDDFFRCVISSNGLAYLTGLGIFLLTAFLVARNLIGFTVSLLFLAFALIAALGVANNETIKSTVDRYTSAPSTKDRETRINEDLQKGFDDLKAEFFEYKKKLEDFLQHQTK